MINYKLDFSRGDALLKIIPERRDLIVADTAFRVEARAKPQTRLLTGAMRNSGYTMTKKRSGRAKAIEDAQSLRPNVSIASPPPDGELGEGKAIVGFAVEYAVYHELGTRFMAAKPFLMPAVEAERKRFLEQLAKGLLK